MQTFLPYPDFERSAKVLDSKRLGKQRVEAFQILRCLLDIRTGWRHHPAVKMWRGCEYALLLYTIACCEEWRERDFRDSVLLKAYALPISGNSVYPRWLGNEAFHASHRSNLLRKDYGYYSQFGWSEPPDLPYVWPVEELVDVRA